MDEARRVVETSFEMCEREAITATLTYVSDVVADREEERRLFDAIGGQHWSSIRFRDARTAAPTGTLAFINGLDEHVGDFPLDVTPTEPDCD